MKKMKKIKYVMLLLCFMFLMNGCTKKEEVKKEKSTSTPLLFEVTKEGSDNKLYLFGSIHVADESLYPLPDYVMDAYKESDAVAVEFDLIEFENNISKQTELVKSFINSEGKLINEYIDQDIYDRAVKILKDAGIYIPMYDYYTPMMWEMLIENAAMMDTELEEKLGVDRNFLTLSKEDKKEILELESAEIQYNMLLGFDSDTEKYLLEQAVNSYKLSVDNLEKTYELYKKGNKDELEKFLFTEETEPDQYTKEYNDKLITERNQNMKTSLEQAFVEGKDVFCTVGLAHIIGEEGLAHSFEQSGYTVKIVK